MAYSGGQSSSHRLPGFAHFESPFSLVTSLHSGLDQFSSSDIVADGPIASTAGLDLSIVNGLDLSSSNYEGLNLSCTNGGVRQGTSNRSSSSSQYQQGNVKSNIHQSTSNFQQQNISNGTTANLTQPQGLTTNETEMVLNLSTQIGLNLTRPGQELDYSQMLGIDHTGEDTFTSGLQDHDYYHDYYPDYYNYTDALCNMEEQRSSPLNLEHRSSPLNLTAVGAINRKRKSTNFHQNGISGLVSQQNDNLQSQSSQNNQTHSNLNITSSNYTTGLTSGNNATAAQTAPINMIGISNNQAFDYRLPNKLTSFYNQQNLANSSQGSDIGAISTTYNQISNKSDASNSVSNFNTVSSTPSNSNVNNNMFTNQQIGIPGLHENFGQGESSNGQQNPSADISQQSSTSNKSLQNILPSVKAVKDSEYDISFSYFENFGMGDTDDEDMVNFNPNTNGNNGYELNYLMGVNSNQNNVPVSKTGDHQNKIITMNEANKIEKNINSKENRIYETNQKFTCDICSQSFIDEVILKSHKKTSHSLLKTPTKSLANSSFDSSAFSNIPVNLSPMKNKIKELAPPSKLSTQIPPPMQKPQNIEGNQVSKNKKVYKCNTCLATFTFQSACKRHERLHLNSKPYSCHKCGKGFSRQFDQKNHLKSHENVEVKKCNTCQKQFESEGLFDDHICVPGKPQYPCPICPRSIPSKREWGAHMWKHTSNAKFIILTEDDELPEYDESVDKK